MNSLAADTQIDTQFHLQWLSSVYISEQQTLLPAAYFHVALEQIACNDEMLDIMGTLPLLASNTKLLYSSPYSSTHDTQ